MVVVALVVTEYLGDAVDLARGDFQFLRRWVLLDRNKVLWGGGAVVKNRRGHGEELVSSSLRVGRYCIAQQQHQRPA